MTGDINKYMAVLLLGLIGVFSVRAEADNHRIAEPKDYRMQNYRAPVPETLQGGTVVDAIELHRLISKYGDAVSLIDVLPLHPKPANFSSDRLWRPPTHYNLPDSIWLPNVGYGTISPQFQQYLVENLKSQMVANRQQRFVFYCEEDCWMSWNAAKRVLALGFNDVYWFPGGTDEWKKMGYELTANKPVTMPVERPNPNEFKESANRNYLSVQIAMVI